MQPILNLKCFNGTSRKTPALLKVKCIKGLNELLFTMPIHNMQIFKVSPFFKQHVCAATMCNPKFHARDNEALKNFF